MNGILKKKDFHSNRILFSIVFKTHVNNVLFTTLKKIVLDAPF